MNWSLVYASTSQHVLCHCKTKSVVQNAGVWTDNFLDFWNMKKGVRESYFLICILAKCAFVSILFLIGIVECENGCYLPDLVTPWWVDTPTDIIRQKWSKFLSGNYFQKGQWQVVLDAITVYFENLQWLQWFSSVDHPEKS